jgi:hypothetical protein
LASPKLIQRVDERQEHCELIFDTIVRIVFGQEILFKDELEGYDVNLFFRRDRAQEHFPSLVHCGRYFRTQVGREKEVGFGVVFFNNLKFEVLYDVV